MDWWLILGLAAQFAFSSRFILQWWASERRGRSYIPISFWYLSLVGSLALLSYAVHRQDPVFILGQALGCIIYVRNLVLIYRQRRRLAGLGEKQYHWSFRVALFIPLVLLTVACSFWVRGFLTEQPQVHHPARSAETPAIRVVTEDAFVRSASDDSCETWALGLYPRVFVTSLLPASSQANVTLLNVDGDEISVTGNVLETRRTVLANGVTFQLKLPPKGSAELHMVQRYPSDIEFFVAGETERDETFFRWFLAMAGNENPDFVALLGDEVGTSASGSARAYEFAVLQSRLFETRIPCFLLPGDSEFSGAEARRAYRARFGPAPYSFTSEAGLFVFVSSAAGSIAQADLAAADNALAAHANLPYRFLFMHRPPAGFTGVDKDDAVNEADSRKLFDLLRKHPVTCVFCAEVRGFADQTIDGTRFLAIGAAGRSSGGEAEASSFLRVRLADTGLVLNRVICPSRQTGWSFDRARLVFTYLVYFTERHPFAFIVCIIAASLWLVLPVLTVMGLRRSRRGRKAPAPPAQPPPDGPAE